MKLELSAEQGPYQGKRWLLFRSGSYKVGRQKGNTLTVPKDQAVSDRQQKLVQQWLDILGIDKRTADAPFHSLSWGQQRLALIVRALVKHPTLLILDEPLQGLDPLNRQLIRRFVDVLISEGETQLLFVSHHAEDAPACITHRLEFVPDGGLYRYVLTKIY